ncbi:hypothetical protein PTKIN_Ptkin07bG0277700 [Pterospermum kingtungense]
MIERHGPSLLDYLRARRQHLQNEEQGDNFFWDGLFFEYVFENGVLVTVQPSKLYAKMIRDLTTTIHVLRSTNIVPDLSKNTIFIKQGLCIFVKAAKFKTRVSRYGHFENAEYESLKKLLKHINSFLGIFGSAKLKFEDFYDYLTDNHMDKVLQRPIFWSKQMRIKFYRGFDDFLKSNKRINIYNDQTAAAFALVGEEWDIEQFFERCDDNNALLHILEAHEEHVWDNEIICLLSNYRKGHVFNNNKNVRFCVEVVRNMHEHFEDLQNYIYNLEFNDSEELQRVIQHTFPRRIVKLFSTASEVLSIDFNLKTSLRMWYYEE